MKNLLYFIIILCLAPFWVPVVFWGLFILAAIGGVIVGHH